MTIIDIDIEPFMLRHGCRRFKPVRVCSQSTNKYCQVDAFEMNFVAIILPEIVAKNNCPQNRVGI